MNGVRGSNHLPIGWGPGSTAKDFSPNGLHNKDGIKYELSHQQIVTVAKSGGNFTTIQAAINSITDAAFNKKYVVHIAPGTYTEDVTLKDYVTLYADTETTLVALVGTITCTSGGGDFGIQNLFVQFTPTADGQSAINISGGYSTLVGVQVYVVGAADFICSGVTVSSNIGSALYTVSVLDRRTGPITKAFNGFALSGTGGFDIVDPNASCRVNYGSATVCLYSIACTGTLSSRGGTATFEDTSGTFTGSMCGINITTASTKPRIISNVVARFTGISGGTAIAFKLDSSGASAECQIVGCTAFISGFTNEYVTSTAAGDTLKVWLNSVNKSLAKTGDGLALVTPYDSVVTGFVDWSTVGATYWSYVPGTRVFTLEKRCTGIVKSSPVVCTVGQTVTLTDYVTNFIYSDSTGVLKSTTTTDVDALAALYKDSVFLTQLYSDGTNYIVKKECHPVEVNMGVSILWHDTISTLLANNGGATITTLVAANRTIKMVGACKAYDHGLTTTIPDSAGAAISFSSFYTGASGMAIDGTGITAIPSKWQNTASTVANANNGQRIVVRVGVILDNLNSTAPQYVYSYHNATYGSNGAAATAIANGVILAFPSELFRLEILQLGYVTIQADGAGGGTIVATTPAKQVFGANFITGPAAAAASGVITDVTNFNNILTSANTNVQSALETLDDHIHYDAWREVTATGNATTTDRFVSLNHASTPITYNLLAANGVNRGPITVKRVGAAACTIDADASETIDGALTLALPAVNSSVTLGSNGTNWFVRSAYKMETAAVWTSYTPTFGGLGTVSAVTAAYMIDGKSIKLHVDVTTGTVAGSAITISLPTGLTVSTSMPSGVYGVCGQGHRKTSTTSQLSVLAKNGDSTIGIGYVAISNTDHLVLANGSDIFGNGERFNFYADIPVDGV